MRYIESILFLTHFIQILGQFGILPGYMLKDNRTAVLIFCLPALLMEGIRVCQIPVFITSLFFALGSYVLNTNNMACGVANALAFSLSMWIR